MENERKYFVFYDANAEGEEPFGEYHINDETVRPIKDKTPRLAPELNFEDPGQGISLKDAVLKVLMGNAVAIGTSEDPASIIMTEDDIFSIYDRTYFDRAEEQRARRISKPL